jgi:hypothetical protein
VGGGLPVDYGSPYTGTKLETADTAKGAPTVCSASSLSRPKGELVEGSKGKPVE